MIAFASLSVNVPGSASTEWRAPAIGGPPPVTGEVVEASDEVVMRVAKAGLDSSKPNKTVGGTEYRATTFNKARLGAAAGLNTSQVNRAIGQLTRSGMIFVRPGPGATIFIR